MSRFTEFKGKTAVVTGGASGIGRGIAEALIAAGMKVVIADIEESALQKTATQIGATGIRTDVTNYASVEALAKEVLARMGDVHVVCNNAGVGSTASLAEMTLEDWKWLLDVNLWGVIHGIKAFLPHLKANRDGGHFVNTASVGGLATMPNLGGYAVTKFGVVALTETLAQELAMENSKVGATVLCPGTVRTNIKTSQRNRRGAAGATGLKDVDLEQEEFGKNLRWIEPREVGEIVVQSIQRGDLYSITHADFSPLVEARFKSVMAAFHDAPAAR